MAEIPKLFDPCIKVGMSKFNLTEEDARAIVEQMRNVAKSIKGGDFQVRVKKIMRAESALQKKWVRQKRIAEKLNKLKDKGNFDRVLESFSFRENLKKTKAGRSLYKRMLKMMGKKPGEELTLSDEMIARYTGSTRLRPGGQDSAASRILGEERAVKGRIFAMMHRDAGLTESEFHAWMRDDQNLEDTITEMFGPNGEGFDLENPTPHTQNKEAHIFAKARVIEKRRFVDLMNAEGAMIGWLPNHAVTQYHDPLKVQRVGKTQWIQDQLELIGEGDAFDRTFGLMDETQRLQFLDAAWHNISEGKRTSTDEAPEIKVPGSLAKRLSQHRKIHYGSSEAWLENFNKYGAADLRAAMWSEMRNLANDYVLLHEFGTNPELQQEKLWTKLRAWSRNPPDGKPRDWNDDTVKNHWMWVNRDAYHLANSTGYGPTLATATQVYLSIQNMSKLGSSVFPSFSDLSTSVQTYRYHGVDYLDGIREHMQVFFRKLSPDERTEVLYQLAEFNDMIIGGFHSRYATGDPKPGRIQDMEDFFFKVNGLSGWTYNNRAAAQFVLSGNIARNLTKSFDQLDPNLQRVLRQYNIDEGDWMVMRDVGVKTIDAEGNLLPDAAPSQSFDLNAKQYFTPDLLERAADSPEMGLADKRSMRDLAMKLRSFFVQEGRIAIPEPDAADRAIMTQGAQRGTFKYSSLVAIWQFRSFPLVYLRKLGPRYAQQGKMYTIGNLAALTAIGYVSMSAKDMLKGKQPKPLDDPKTWAAAFIFSGAGGIAGDFIFNDFQRYGGGVADVVGGPGMDLVTDWAQFFTMLAKGDDAAAKAFNNAIRMAPFANLWYTRTALDYMFIYNIQNFLNPGTLRRRERRMKRDYNQQHMRGMRPSTSPLRKASPLYMMGIK